MSEAVEFIVSDNHTSGSSTTQNISDGSFCKIKDIRGRGLSQVEHNIVGSPSALGGQFAGLQFMPREITLSIIFETDSEANAVTRRDAIYELFKPFNPLFFGSLSQERGCWLKITRGDSSVRQIKCQSMGIVDFPIIANDPVNSGGQSAGKWRGQTTVKLLCPDPFWYDPTVATETNALSGTFSGSFSISTSGTTAFMYPVFTIVGPLDSLVLSEGRGHTINIGQILGSETITIDLRPFRKTIQDQVSAYRFDLLTAGFNTAFANFGIIPAWNGTSTISYSGTGASGSASATIEYYKRYVAA